MAASTATRPTAQRPGTSLSLPAASAGYGGCMVAINDAGLAVPATATAANYTAGVAEADYAAGAEVRVLKGIWAFDSASGADQITAADIGSICYVVDDQTVALTNATNTRPAAGRIFDVDAYGVWVSFV